VERFEITTRLRQPGLDATNWRTELAIRFGVILRKVWGGSRTWAWARAQSILMSGVTDLLAAGPFGRVLPESASAGPAGSVGLAPVNYRMPGNPTIAGTPEKLKFQLSKFGPKTTPLN
jgi:hypothetical protein